MLMYSYWIISFPTQQRNDKYYLTSLLMTLSEIQLLLESNQHNNHYRQVRSPQSRFRRLLPVQSNGLIQFSALGIIIGFSPIGDAFMTLADSGSTPELEGRISRYFNIAAIPIWTTYALIFIAAWLGTTKALIG